MAKINLDKEIWEGWRVKDFIENLEMPLQMIMGGQSWMKPITNKADLKRWCMENQPYYKRYIPDVVNYFAKKYNIK